MMVLKRLTLVALGALGLGALAAGPASAQNKIPAPDSLRDLTACIEANTPERMEQMRRPVRPPLDYTSDMLTVTVAALYNVADCMDIKLDPEADAGDGVDLMEMVARARTAFGSLPDDDDDDYAEELADVQERFSGTIFERVFDEVMARDDTVEARDDLIEARNNLHIEQTDDDLTGVLDELYRALTLHTDEHDDTDDINLPTITGVTFDADGDLVSVTAITTGVGGADSTGLADGVIQIDTDNLGSLLNDRRLSIVAIATRAGGSGSPRSGGRRQGAFINPESGSHRIHRDPPDACQPV